MEILKKLSTETLKKMLNDLKTHKKSFEIDLTLCFIRAELLNRKEL